MDHAPVLGLSDLEVMLELMGDEATILHYLLRRTDFERTADFMADEHDLIAYYLRDGFNVAEAEEGELHLALYGMSDMLRDYYPRTPGDPRTAKPRPLLTALWKDWIEEICRRKPKRWVSMSRMLLDVDMVSQRGVSSQALGQAAAEVRAGRGRPAFHATFVPTGPRHRRGAIVPLVYGGVPRAPLQSLIDNLCDEAKREIDTERVLVIGMDVANPRPYSVIALHDPT